MFSLTVSVKSFPTVSDFPLEEVMLKKKEKNAITSLFVLFLHKHKRNLNVFEIRLDDIMVPFYLKIYEYSLF